MGHEEKFEQLPNIYNNEIEQAKKEFIENKKETYVYYRTYLDKQGASYCYFPKMILILKEILITIKKI